MTNTTKINPESIDRFEDTLTAAAERLECLLSVSPTVDAATRRLAWLLDDAAARIRMNGDEIRSEIESSRRHLSEYWERLAADQHMPLWRDKVTEAIMERRALIESAKPLLALADDLTANFDRP